MEKQSPVQRIWELGEAEHGRLITAVVLAVVGVVCGMVHYFAAARIIVLLLAGERALAAYTPWRLALLSMAVFPIAFVFMMMVMGFYAKAYAGAVQAPVR